MTRLPAWTRAALTTVVVLCAAVAVLTVPSSGSPKLSLSSADATQFDAGNIISDALFFDYNALTPQQIQDFIAAKGAYCTPNGSVPCLKDYRESTWTRPSDSICKDWYNGASNETAGWIIWRAAQACHISPKVLLVLLQKEQALLTASGTRLNWSRYQSATGMGCPDTAACDSQYYGFYNQVYSAARQYQRYATYPASYQYVAHQYNDIQWSPDTSCGTSSVFIANQATAGLYNYTPYRPNTAALQAGYGTGDYCSAYGNRNFWLYYTDWFGSTQSIGGDAILAAYAARGGASGPLGPTVTWVICGLAGGGCGQVFQNGTLYWSAATGAYAVSDPYLTAWGWQRESGPLGYPIADSGCGMWAGGCGQAFQNGRIYSTWSTGTHAIKGPIQDAWIAQGFENGALHYPSSDEVCGLVKGGCSQIFMGGRIYYTPTTGAQAVSGAILDAWIAQGVEAGWLGYPTSGQACGLTASGCGQVFQYGRIYQSASTGAHAISGPIQDAWIAQGSEAGSLGYPTGDQVCGLYVGGCKQEFQGGTVYSTWSTGARAVSGAIATAWTATGAESGTLGYPTTGQICGLKNGGCGQVFQRGRIYQSTGTGAHAITGPIQDAWVAQGYEAGPLGYPTGDQVCGLYVGGCKQDFQGGTVYSTWSTGAHPVSGAIATAWTATGAESGTLGYPTTGLICGMKNSGCGQVFQRGRIYQSTGTGAHAISGPIQDAWIAQGWEGGPLGYPTGDQVCGLYVGGCKQDFQGGTVYWTWSTGAHTVSGAIGTAWTATGAESGTLGYPTTGLICGMKNSGCGQVFQHGRIYQSTGTGAHAITGPIQDAWIAQGWEAGTLGYPTSDPYAVSGGTAQDFQGGRLTLQSSTGTVTRS